LCLAAAEDYALTFQGQRGRELSRRRQVRFGLSVLNGRPLLASNPTTSAAVQAALNCIMRSCVRGRKDWWKREGQAVCFAADFRVGFGGGTGLPEPAEDWILLPVSPELSRKLGTSSFTVSTCPEPSCLGAAGRGEVYRLCVGGRDSLERRLCHAAGKELEMSALIMASRPTSFPPGKRLSGVSEKLNQLAARWSLDPAALPQSTWKAHGVVGSFAILTGWMRLERFRAILQDAEPQIYMSCFLPFPEGHPLRQKSLNLFFSKCQNTSWPC